MLLGNEFLFGCFAALGAAFCWAVSPFVSLAPSQNLGAVLFGLIRQVFAGVILVLIGIFNGGLAALSTQDIWILASSGIVGIFIGDGLLFAGLRRLGPRRNQMLFSTNAPMIALLGFLFLDELLTFESYLGVLLVTIGVIIAIAFKENRNLVPIANHLASSNKWEQTLGPLYIGIAFALLAALGQAIGVLMTRPIMEAGNVDAFAANAIRIGSAGIGFAVIAACQGKISCKPIIQKFGMNVFMRDIGFTFLSAIFGMVFGMTLLLISLKFTSSAIAATLSATSPIMLLPILWILAHKKPHPSAWIGAVLATVGTIFITL